MTATLAVSQIGSKGTVLFEASFGLAFTGDLLIDRKVKMQGGHRRITGQKRERVIRLLSPCCGAAYQEGKCYCCKQDSTWKTTLLDFTLSQDVVEATTQWEPILESWYSNVFENSLIAMGLINAINEVFENIKAGKRTREVVLSLPLQEV